MTERSAFEIAASGFVHDLDAVREMLDPVMFMAFATERELRKKHLKILEEHGTLRDESTKEKTFDVPMEHIRAVSKAGKKSERAATANRMLPRTFLVSFVSVYDAFLGRLIHALLEAKPEILDNSERQLTYKQLLEHKSIEDARERLAETEVESVLRQSHSDQFKWLENKFGIKLRDDLASWPTFIELTERRNLFVHTHGKVSTQYLTVCRNNKCDVDDTKIGDTLDAGKKYLVSAYKCLYEIGIKLSQVLWRKLKPTEVKEADAALNAFAYELLLDEKYDIATRLLEFAVNTLKKHSDERFQRMFAINLAQAYKFSGNTDGCIKLIDSYDWSSSSDDFGICVAVLRDKFDEAAVIMERIGTTGLINEHGYVEWPVFKVFRESDEFKGAFRKVFGRDPTGVQKRAVQSELTFEEVFPELAAPATTPGETEPAPAPPAEAEKLPADESAERQNA